MMSMPNPEKSFLRPHILEMEPYTPILPFEVLSEQLEIPAEKIIKLDANENPYGILPEVAQALQDIPYPHIYPDPESRVLRQGIAQVYQVPYKNILVGAGADELIDLIMRVVLDPGDLILNCPPTFGMYAFDAAVNDAQVISVPRRADFELDIAGICTTVKQYQPKLLFLANPNNPDGSVVDPDVLEKLLELPILVVVDEAYMDFAEAGKSILARFSSPEIGGRLDGFSNNYFEENLTSPYLAMRNNLIVLRTFSKRAALAGLRVGFGVFPDWMMPHLWKVKQPYNVSVAAATAAISALENVEKLELQGQAIIAERDCLFKALENIPWLKPYPSQANFILCKIIKRDAAKLKADLAKQGILIRYFNKPGLQDHIRISVGRPEQMDTLLQALARIEIDD
jgi:histidinol-phosphate aminotransferase